VWQLSRLLDLLAKVRYERRLLDEVGTALNNYKKLTRRDLVELMMRWALEHQGPLVQAAGLEQANLRMACAFSLSHASIRAHDLRTAIEHLCTAFRRRGLSAVP